MIQRVSPICAAAIMLISLPASVQAAGGNPQAARLIAEKTIEIQDRDGDRHISLKESAGASLVLFTSIDKDGSGTINPDEMMQTVRSDVAALNISDTEDQTAPLVATRFRSMDINGDGWITLPEMLAVNQTLFDSADSNADGLVSETELSALAMTQSPSENAR